MMTKYATPRIRASKPLVMPMPWAKADGNTVSFALISRHASYLKLRKV
jgi:hypothetical protein